MRLFLIGFMGSGKTHWGKLLAEKTGLPFFDLDKVIADTEQQSIPDIFAEKGEEYFRSREKAMLEQLSTEQEACIISCGGGTPCFFNNIDFMKKMGKVIWLNTHIDVLLQRLMKEKNSRPLLKNIPDKDLRPYIIKKLQDRKMYYEQADIVMPEENITIETFTEIVKHA